MVDGARLESVYTSQGYRGFESLTLCEKPDCKAVGLFCFGLNACREAGGRRNGIVFLFFEKNRHDLPVTPTTRPVGMKKYLDSAFIRLVFVLALLAASHRPLAAQVPDDLGTRTVAYENRTLTYRAMHAEVLDFFKKNRVGTVARRVKDLEPYLSGKLTSTRRRELETHLKAISDLRERGTPITKNRKMLGALVAGLRTELQRPIIVAAEDPASAAANEPVARPEATEAIAGDETVRSSTANMGEADSSWFSWLGILTVLLALLSAGLGFVVYRARLVITRLRADRETVRLETTSWKEKAKSQQITLDELKEQNTLLRGHVEELEAERAVRRNVEPLVAATEARRGGALSLEPELAAVAAPPSVPAPVVEFFLGLPQADGSFADQRSSQFNPAHSFYRFRLDKNSQEATFEFADNPATVTTALRQPEACLDPVCEYAQVDYGARRIFTMMPGRVRKTSPDEDRWELVTKAIIRFSTN